VHELNCPVEEFFIDPEWEKYPSEMKKAGFEANGIFIIVIGRGKIYGEILANAGQGGMSMMMFEG
jgi:hypothetical protein